MRLIAIFLLIGVSTVSEGLSSLGSTPFDYRDPVPRDPYSEELVKKAEAGDAVAQWNLGMCYSGGWQTSTGFVECKEVKKNPEEAIKWLRKSAEQGNPEAQLEMYGYYVEMVKEELMDLTEEEQNKLVAELKKRFDLQNDSVELLIEDVIDHVFLTIKLARRFASIKK